MLALPPPQYSVLAQLELESGISNAELARRSFITAQTTHGIVSNLESRQLIKRVSNPKHGRILCAALTEQGLNTVKKAHKLIHDVEEQMTSTLSVQKKEMLKNILDECLSNLHVLAS